MGSRADADGHIVMLPLMAHGHLIPFVALARTLLCRTTFTITVATTPLNVRYLRSILSSSASSDGREIHLAELPYCSADHGLPPDAEHTENLPLDKIMALYRSSDSLAGPLEQLLSKICVAEGQRPVCLISDFFFGWSVEVARRLGIECFTFTTGASSVYKGSHSALFLDVKVQ